jgi:trimeric autotransporter adhesin
MRKRLLAPGSGLVALALAALCLVATPAGAAYDEVPRQSWSANGTVYAIAVSGGRVYIGGRFTRLKNTYTGEVVNRSRLAAFDATTGRLITSFAPSADDDVLALAVSSDGGTVFAGGAFGQVNGQARSHIAALSTSGALAPGWSGSASSTVWDLETVGKNLYVAGLFARYDDVRRGGLAKVNAGNGALDTHWQAVTGGGRPRALALAPNGTDLIVAGTFGTLDGQPRTYMGSVGLSSGAVTGWSPPPACATCDVYDVTAAGDAVYAGTGGGGGRVARWSASSGRLIWRVHADGNVQALALRGKTLYVGGHFGPTFGGKTRHQLAAVSTGTGRVLAWNPALGGRDHPGVWALDTGPDFLRVGGGFTSVGGRKQARYAEFRVL